MEKEGGRASGRDDRKTGKRSRDQWHTTVGPECPSLSRKNDEGSVGVIVLSYL